MSYGDFTLSKVKKELGIEIIEGLRHQFVRAIGTK